MGLIIIFQVAINVPIFRDTETKDPLVTEADILAKGESGAKPWHIYMDAMGFGMGLSCLQLTFQVLSQGFNRKSFNRLFCIG